jgi:putative peptidoglycan lipid II flippase
MGIRLPTFVHRALRLPKQQIFRAAFIVGLCTLLVKIGSTLKELIVAGRFGRTDAIDAFLIAYLLPSFVLILVGGAFGYALIPALVEARHNRGEHAAQALFSSMMFLSMLATVGVALLLGLLAPYYLPYLASGFNEAKLHLTRHLLYALLPFIVFGGFASQAGAVLNASQKFALAAITPLITPLTTILLIAIGPRSWGPFLLAGGAVAGSLIEAGLLGQALRIQGLHLKPQWNGLTEDVRSVLKQYAPILAGIFLMSSTAVVDQSMAAMLSPGSVSALSYANKVVNVIVTIGATALSTGAFPFLAQMVARKDLNECRRTLKRYSVLAAALSLPVMIVIILLSKPLVELLFQRGAFTGADSGFVSRVQICYALQIPFYICCSLFVRFLASLRRNDVLLYIAAGSLALDIVFNLLLMRIWGVAGIALSTSLVYVFTFVAVALYSLRVIRKGVEGEAVGSPEGVSSPTAEAREA